MGSLLDTAKSCWVRGCKAKLTPEPPPIKKGQHEWTRTRWTRVAIRCVYCWKVFCPKHAREHFKPEHVATPLDEVTVKKQDAFIVFVGSTPVAACLNEHVADWRAKIIRDAADSSQTVPPRRMTKRAAYKKGFR